MTNNIGLILLAIFLILLSVTYFGIMIPGILLGVVGLLAAIFILVGR